MPFMKTRAFCRLASVFVAFGLSTQVPQVRAQAETPPLMPLPSHIDMGDDQFLVDGNLNVALEGYTEPRLLFARERFMGTLSRETGIPFPQVRPGTPANFTVKTTGASNPVQELDEDESYHLKVSANGVQL